MQQNQQFRNITYLADRQGTGKWRHVWPIQCLDCIAQGANIQSDYSQTPILDHRYYDGMNSITIQRWISNQQKEIVEKLFKPCMNRNAGWLIYAIDDLMDVSEIPPYNRGRAAFEPKEIQDNIRYMLNASDFVFVTTEYIKKCYNKYYGVPLENIIAIPNFLPRYLFDDRYDKNRKIEQYKAYKSKPRIGIVSSLSHYNIDGVRMDKNGLVCRKQTSKDQNGNATEIWVNQNNEVVNISDTIEIQDDFDIIVDVVRQTIDDFQWVFFGYCPPKIEDLWKKQKVEYYGGIQIMNYPSRLENLQLQAIVAPIQSIEFNKCKSFIKYMECAAIGVPLYASNELPYKGVVDEHHLFNNGDDLKEKLFKLKNGSVGSYEKTIEKQWRWLNSPCKEGDFNIRNFWLEDNLNIFVDMNRLRNKCIDCSLQQYLKIKAEQEKQKRENTIFSNDNGVEILR